MAHLESVIKKDYMVKRSMMKGILKNENYKSRWFLLSMNYLRYCDGNLLDGVGRTKGEVTLRSVVAVEVVPFELFNRANMFQVVYRSLENDDETVTLYIQAVHDEQRNEWVELVKSSSLEAGAQMDHTYHSGTYRNGRYTCCDAINKYADGCCSTTPAKSVNGVSNMIENGSKNESVIKEPSQPSKSKPKPVPSTGPQPPPKQKRSPPDGKTSSPITNIPDDCPTDPAPVLPTRPVPKPREVKKKLLALYDFQAVEQGDLSIVRGEQYEQVEDAMGTWIKLKSKDGKTGYAPLNYLQALDASKTNASSQLKQYEWYYGEMTITQAEEVLKKDGTEGCFIVRDSRKAGMYSLSLFTKKASDSSVNGVVKHYHIRKTSGGKFYITEQYDFKTLPELVVFHKQDAHGLVSKLTSPPTGPSARNSFLPTAGLGHEAKEILHSELTLMEELGAGQFGRVVHGLYKGTIHVAVKMMKETSMSENQFLLEAVTMTKLNHKNLVTLYGVCTKPLYIVTEYMKYGALLGYLRRNKHVLLNDVAKLTDMASQVCSGMVYLENAGFIHRDLAARNCLVGENSVVKVADFGLTRFLSDDEYDIRAGTKFPVRWSAPEVLQQNKYSIKSDVWSFGVLVWEIFSGGELPYGSLQQSQLVDHICTQRKRLSQPPKCPEQIYRIMSTCWAQNPDVRPTFGRLKIELDTVAES